MRRNQDQMVREDRMVIHQALMYAAQSGSFDLSVDDVMSVNVEVKPPRVQTRNRQEDFDIGYKLWEGSLLDGKQLMAQEGFEFDQSQPQVKSERAAEIPPPMIAKVPVTGPEPDAKGDPMKEKGVSKGDPTKTV
jgi:hypothetical protein